MVEKVCVAVFFDHGSVWARWGDGSTTKIADLPTGWPPARFAHALSASARALTLDAPPVEATVVQHPPLSVGAGGLGEVFAALSRQIDRLSVEVHLWGQAGVSNLDALKAAASATVLAAVQLERVVGHGGGIA